MKDNDSDTKTEAKPKNDAEMKNKDVIRQGCLGTVIAVVVLFFCMCYLCNKQKPLGDACLLYLPVSTGRMGSK